MPVFYDFYENPQPNEDGQPLYHPRAVTTGTVSTEEIARDIQKATSLTEGDVVACLTALSYSLQTNLSASRRVHLEGIGYFQLSLEAPPAKDPKQYNASNVHIKAIRYRADKVMKERMSGAKFMRRAMSENHSSVREYAKVERLLMDYLAEYQYITTSQLIELCNLRPSTARRHLARLREEGKIENIASRNAPIYQISPFITMKEEWRQQ